MTTDQPTPPDAWVSIQEAARWLGISPISVRRRIRRGTLEAELQPGSKGNEYRVRLPAESSPDQAGTTQASSQVLSEMLGVIERQQIALVEEGKAAAEWRTRAEMLEAEVEQLRPELERARWPWWRRWLGP